MINASEARTNVNNFKNEKYNKIKQVVDEILKTISNSIEFLSEKGFEFAEFFPYNKSCFPSSYSLQVASDIFEQILKNNGYEIVQNDWENNILKVKW